MRILKKLLLLGIFGVSLSTFAAPPSITDKKMELEFVPVPNYKIINGSNVTNSAKNWMVINLSYKMPNLKARSKNKSQLFLDNAYIEWEVLSKLNVGNKTALGMITGKTTYWSIPIDGNVHRALAVLPHSLLKRYLPNNVQSAINKTVFVRATLYNEKDKVLATWYSSDKNKKGKARTLFNRVKNNKNAVKIEGGIYPKNKTAWSFINIQKYDLIKEEKVK